MGGAPGASSLLLNTKASQEAACSQAPATIVPGPEPEPRDAGASRFGENGSHLEAADAGESHAGLVGGPGSSGNTGIGSHLAVGVAEGLAGGVPPGVNENGQVGRWDFGKGKARAALSARKCHQRYMATCIGLKMVDSKKETIIMKLRSELQKKYYQQVIDFHQKTGLSPHKMAKMQLFPVSVTQMYEWIAIFDAENGKGSPRRIMEAKKSKEQEELESLKSRISELEESLRVERLRNRLNEKIIDIAEARWHIEIRKKAGTKR